MCPEDVKDLEKIYNMFSACLEYFEIQLLKTLFVQREFPLHSGKPIIEIAFTDANLQKKNLSKLNVGISKLIRFYCFIHRNLFKLLDSLEDNA